MNIEYLLSQWMSRLIDERSREYQKNIIKNKTHISLLLAGYVGSRNTGADVRVEEMIRQMRHLLSKEKVGLTLLTLNQNNTSDYFKAADQMTLPHIFPKFLFREIKKFDGVVACEGSMFKSKFANSLTLMMAGALGLANAEEKLSVGYGAEAGNMDPFMEEFVKKYCKQSLIICRNEASRKILGDLKIRTASGTDTAWTFEASSKEKSKIFLQKNGWDTQKPLVYVCPINPFWWPVKPNIGKYFLKTFFPSTLKETHYKSIYFHQYSEESKKQYQSYLRALKTSLEYLEEKYNTQSVLVAMEMLDEKAANDLSSICRTKKIILSSREYNMYDLVGMLRLGSFMISSRFHAIVTSMPAGVASIGVTMDERIENLMEERNQSKLFCHAQEENLEERLLNLTLESYKDRESISKGVLNTIPSQLKKMAFMGETFLLEMSKKFPNLIASPSQKSFENFLPPLNPNLQNILEAA